MVRGLLRGRRTWPAPRRRSAYPDSASDRSIPPHLARIGTGPFMTNPVTSTLSDMP